jgi:hypothetical protein
LSRQIEAIWQKLGPIERQRSPLAVANQTYQPRFVLQYAPP